MCKQCYELHNHIMALRPNTLCSTVLAIRYGMGPGTNKCLLSGERFVQM